jgi:hypothetical protein
MTAATARRSVYEALGEDQSRRDHSRSLVHQIGFGVKFTESLGLASFKVVCALTSPAGVELGLLALEFLLLEFSGATIPVSNLAVEAFLNRTTGLVDAGSGDTSNLAVVRRGEVGSRPVPGNLIDSLASPVNVDVHESFGDVLGERFVVQVGLSPWI